MSSDWRPKTQRFPGAQFGIVLGTRRLAERIGAGPARRLVIEGGQLDAQAALVAGLVTAVGQSFNAIEPRVDASTARAVRAASRRDAPDADLAALVRSAAVPGLKARIQAYRQQLR